jgi:Mechanosensitive ion channel, conserved TM helix
MDIGDSVQNALDTLFGFLPNLLGCLVILIIGYIIARVVQALAAKLLLKVGVDRMLSESQGGRFVDRMLPGASASRGVARLLFWLVFAFFIVAAIGALRLDSLNDFMNSALSYLPNVIVAILIFVVAAAVAGMAGSAASRGFGDGPTGRIVGAVVPALVMVIATFMILDQLQIAAHIVSIAFAATMFAVALGLALAFGLGGRDLARQVLEEAYAKRRTEAAGRADSAAVGGSHVYGDDSHEAYFSPERQEMTSTGTPRSGARGTETTTRLAGERYPTDPNPS